MDSSLASSSPIRNAPANAMVATAQIRCLSCGFLSDTAKRSLNTNIMAGVIGNLPVYFCSLFWMLLLFAMPFNTNLTNPLLKQGGSMPFMM